MLADRDRVTYRGLAARVRARLRVGSGLPDGDRGFTMVEMMVALTIIGIVMAALATFFVNTVSLTSRQGSVQAATQLADDAGDRVRAVKGSTIINGRGKAGSDTQWVAPVTGVSAYLGDSSEAYDHTCPTCDGTAALLPTNGKTTTLSGLIYTQNWYIGVCWQPQGGGSCIKPTSSDMTQDLTVVVPTGYVAYYRVVIAVTWNNKACLNNQCSFITSSLVSAAKSEPLFNSNLKATAPVVDNPSDQFGELTVATTLQLTASGGTGVLTWTALQLPTGLTITGTGLVAGTPTRVGTFTVTVTATDEFGLHDSETFNWTIAAQPVITNPGTQTDGVNATVALNPTLTGGTGTATWTAVGLPAGLTLNTSSGKISGKPTTAGTSAVTLSVKDSYNQVSTVTFSWVINPPLQITTPADQTSNQNVTITNLTVAASGGVTPYSWAASGLPTGLSINASGVISGKPTVAGVSTVKVTVTDSDGTALATNNFKWTVIALTITNPTNNLSSTKSTAITAITATATGGTGTGYTWTSVSGTGNNKLPTGLTISAAGVISGTPTATGVFSVTLKVTDSAAATDTQAFTWTINTAPSITTPTGNQTSTVGKAIVSITSVASGGTVNTSADYAWSATGLPTSVSIDPDSGVISGTPSVAGTYSVSIKVTDLAGATGTQALTWTVAAAPSITTPTTTSRTNDAGTAITSITSVATGGTGTKTWSATGLPTSVNITSAGVISGTPSVAGTYAVTVKVTDSLGATDTQSFSWVVDLHITSPSGAMSTKKSTAVSFTPTVSGATGSLTWSVSGLPTGLSLASTSTGKITGTTNTTIKGYAVTISVTDSAGHSDSFAYTWSVTN